MHYFMKYQTKFHFTVNTQSQISAAFFLGLQQLREQGEDKVPGSQASVSGCSPPHKGDLFLLGKHK